MILIDSRSPERIRLGLTIDVVDDSLACLLFGKDLLVVEFHLGHGKLVAEQSVEKPHENPLVACVPNMRLKPKSERHSMKGVLCMSE